MYTPDIGGDRVSPARRLSMGRALLMALAMVVAVGLGACTRDRTELEAPPPSHDTGEASGYYCGMLLAEHAGPKGQIHLGSRAEPLWFSSVHDTIVFTRLPEEPRDITAMYVHDMGQADDWDNPPNVWVDAKEAVFVIGSDRLGGMGAPEAVPFSDSSAAESFMAQHGGKMVALDDIPDEYFSGLVDGHAPTHDPQHEHADHHHAIHEE